MSGSKRKVTTTTTSSNGKHKSSGTQARQSASPTRTTRMRTRNQAKAQRAASPKRPGRPGRPKLRHDIRQDNVFAIKDIIDEKHIHGRRHYKIDWQDDPNTGESFSPTWVCQLFPHKLKPWANLCSRSPQRTQTGTLSRIGRGRSSAVLYSVSHRRASPTLNPLRPQRLARFLLEVSLLSCSPSRIS